jgi:hypothetical protein
MNADYYIAKATKSRREAKVVRIVSNVFFALAVFFTLAALVMIFTGAQVTSVLVTASSVLIITTNAFNIRGSARSQEQTARMWDRLAADYPSP